MSPNLGPVAISRRIVPLFNSLRVIATSTQIAAPTRQYLFHRFADSTSLPASQAESHKKRRLVPPAPASLTPRPEYEMTFTCTPCSTRSTHRVSKQGYHHGSVLVTCPECRNRHVISDHLGMFGDTKVTIETLMAEKGQLVKRGTLSGDGDLEFWQDGSTTKRAAQDTETSMEPEEIKGERGEGQ